MLARQVPPVSHGSPLEEEAGDEITPIRAALYLPRCLRRFTNRRSRWLYAPPANHHPWRFVQPCSAFHEDSEKKGRAYSPAPRFRTRKETCNALMGFQRRFVNGWDIHGKIAQLGSRLSWLLRRDQRCLDADRTTRSCRLSVDAAPVCVFPLPPGSQTAAHTKPSGSIGSQFLPSVPQSPSRRW